MNRRQRPGTTGRRAASLLPQRLKTNMTVTADAIDRIAIETRISLVLARVLRHKPQEIGLTLDRNAWAEIDALIAGLNDLTSPSKELMWSLPLVDRALIDRVVTSDDEMRFEISPCGRYIRAVRGHSVEIDLQCVPATPPDFLFHGTSEQALSSIRREGLTPQSRQAVHLAPDPHAALYACHRSPTVLVVSAKAMHEAGHVFQVAPNGTWLTDRVPPRFLRFPKGAFGS
jgi:putative RNA 2'-phosphotransferase